MSDSSKCDSSSYSPDLGSKTTEANDINSIHCDNKHTDKPINSLAKEDSMSKKKVRFPESGNVIKDYCEISIPGPDCCSSSELIRYYTQACHRHLTAPQQFLIDQLKGIDLSVCNERYSSLNLKGLKIVAQQMEAMEEVLRRAHFREIDMEDCNIDDITAANLFDMLLHYESCTDLTLSAGFEKPNPRSAWIRCLYYLRRTHELQSLHLVRSPLTKEHFISLSLIGFRLESASFRDCQMSGQTLQMFARWLRALLSFAGVEFGSSVYKHLGRQNAAAGASNDNNFIGTKSAPSSSRASKANPTWRTIKLTQRYSLDNGLWKFRFHLPENRLVYTDIESLFPLVRHHLLMPKNLCELFPFNDFIKTPSAEEFLAIRSHLADEQMHAIGGNGYLFELNLSQNSLKDDGLKLLCSAILMAYQAVRTRVQAEAISWLTKLENYSESIAQELIAQASPRQLLDYARVDHVRQLERLNLSSNGLTKGSMQALASVLRLSTTLHSRALLGGLTHLDLSNNPGIGDAGLETLAEGLIRNQSLRQLCLRDVQMHFNGLYAICSYLTETWTLELLDIRKNFIEVDGIIAVARTLYHNYSLTTLLMETLSTNLIDHNSNPHLHNNGPSKEQLEIKFKEEIQQHLKRNRSIPEEYRGQPKTKIPEPEQSSLNDVIGEAEALLERSADVSTVGEDEQQAARDLEELLAAEIPEASTSLPTASTQEDENQNETSTETSPRLSAIVEPAQDIMQLVTFETDNIESDKEELA